MSEPANVLQLNAATPDERAISAEIKAIRAQLNADERAVCDRVSLGLHRRMLAGRTAYAPLDVASDRRDLAAEALEECIDGAAYLSMLALARSRR